MAAAKKPTSQQVAQGKARAGGNNPIKVTDAGLKKLGKVAVTAATMLPAGRAVKAASVIAKAGSEGRAVARGLKAAQGKSLAPKGYKPDTAGRTEAKRFAEPLKKTFGNKDAARHGSAAVGMGRTSYKIEGSPVNKGKPIIKVQPKSNVKAEPKPNVKVRTQSVGSKFVRNNFNEANSSMARNAKSGRTAFEEAKAIKLKNDIAKFKPSTKKTIKITGK